MVLPPKAKRSVSAQKRNGKELPLPGVQKVTPEEKHARFERALKAFSRRVMRETGIGLSAALLYSECEQGSTYFFCSHSVEAAEVERLMILSLEDSRAQRLQIVENERPLPIQ